MIIFNWPERCPACGHKGITASSHSKMSSIITTRVSEYEQLQANEMAFTCHMKGCGHSWKITLATTDPQLYVKDNMVMALADPGVDSELGRDMLAIDETWKNVTLSTVLSKCAARIAEVARHVGAQEEDE